MSTKVFWFLTACIALCVIGIFWFFSPIFHSSSALETEKRVMYWSENGDFVYSGWLASSLNYSGSFFTGATEIEDIKTFKSEPHFSPRFYIEYPNFSEIQNIEILSNVRRKITSLSTIPTESWSLAVAGYTADFSLSDGNNIGSVIYSIKSHLTDGATKEIHKETFLLQNSGKFLSGASLINTEKTTDLTDKILHAFQTKYPNQKTHDLNALQQNLVSYLTEPQFAFSGKNIQFFLPSEIFAEKNGDLPVVVEIEIPYENLKENIFLEPKVEKKIPEKKTQAGVSSDGKKYVALTFDDGPHKDFTLNLLDTLKAKWVKATFFMLGQNVERYPVVVQRAQSEGHEIASHSWDHKAYNKMSKQQMRTDQQKTDLAFENAIHQKPKLFRPPYGAYDENVKKTVDKTILMWSVDSLDWKNRNVEKNLRTALSQVHDGAIILFHDIHKTSVDTIPALIDRLRAQWYEFLTVSELYEKYYPNETFLPGQVCFSMRRCH